MTWKVWRLFVNTLTPDDKGSVITRDNSMQTIQTHLTRKPTIFSQFFAAFLICALSFEHFKKKWPSLLLCFRNYPPRKTWLEKFLKAPVWEDPSVRDIVNAPKHWFNPNASTFTILIDDFEGNWVGKVTLSDMKSLENFF